MFRSDASKPRILLVDDDPSQVHLLSQVLKDVGQLYFEQDGVAALSRVVTLRPDVILLDIQMPGLDGFEVLRQLQSSQTKRHIPVIFITAHDSMEHQLRCLREGAVDFIPKPLQPEVVAARVQTQLKLRQRERELVSIYRHAKVTLSSIGDAVITTDNQCRVTYMNPMAEVMTGWTLDQASGVPIEQVMPLRIGDEGPPHTNPVRIAVREKRVVGMALNCQMMNQAHKWVPVEDSAAPLVSNDDEVLGAVIVFHEVDAAKALALKMAHQAQYDQLTNLPNRFLMLNRITSELEASAKAKRKAALVLLDIDHFKGINEQFGFEFGDMVIQTVAKRIKALLQHGETLSRQQSDVFMVLVPDAEVDTLNTLLTLIRKAASSLADLHPELDDFGVSMGVSLYPDDSTDAQMLMLHADSALNRAKTDPAAEGLSFFSLEYEERFTFRRQRMQTIKHALSDDRVVVLYQPLVDALSGQVIAVEALMRLRCLDGTLMPPSEFISLAEESRLIIPLSERMIDLALDQQRQWALEGRSVRVCLNISAVQFIDPGFWPHLHDVMAKHHSAPHMIELEVTESLMMRDLDQVTQNMQAMRSLGITISIDDFGTGYSSLTYLHKLPIDVLKIDKSFVQRLTPEQPEDVLIRTITALAQNFGFQTVAEGVETEYQVKKLQALGVNLLQGYRLSKPVVGADIATQYPL